ncbi:hypothetical protein KUTeg_021697 [Tegillarca granosa]|uniref:Huntingtin n=1 Tax=Tegillarca granosa TaxID=220873 RepID=A0ABQ9EA81_TEGGR|nr:hypothetical protein KUTeg_021697 [Tegillarca granosa]
MCNVISPHNFFCYNLICTKKRTADVNHLHDDTTNSICQETRQEELFIALTLFQLLLFICGSKEKYRQLRDIHAIESHLKAVTELCREGGLDISDITPTCSVILSYDTLLSIVDVLSFLVRSSIVLDEGVSPTLLQLLQLALCGSTGGSGSKPQPQASDSSGSTSSPAKQKKDKDKDKDKNEDSDDGQKYDESLSINLVQLLTRILDKSLMIKFIQTFLLESNATSIRWQAHSLVYNIYK